MLIHLSSRHVDVSDRTIVKLAVGGDRDMFLDQNCEADPLNSARPRRLAIGVPGTRGGVCAMAQCAVSGSGQFFAGLSMAPAISSARAGHADRGRMAPKSAARRRVWRRPGAWPSAAKIFSHRPTDAPRTR